MNINTRTGVIDIRQPHPCDNCGHVVKCHETIEFKGHDLMKAAIDGLIEKRNVQIESTTI